MYKCKHFTVQAIFHYGQFIRTDVVGFENLLMRAYGFQKQLLLMHPLACRATVMENAVQLSSTRMYAIQKYSNQVNRY